MRLTLSLFLLLFLNNCSLNKDSHYWTKDPIKKKDEEEDEGFLPSIGFITAIGIISIIALMRRYN